MLGCESCLVDAIKERDVIMSEQDGADKDVDDERGEEEEEEDENGTSNNFNITFCVASSLFFMTPFSRHAWFAVVME